MNNQLYTGSFTLTRFILRRDRILLLIWLIGISGFIVALVPVFENLITQGSSLSVLTEMMKNPAMVAMVGPVYGSTNSSTGALFGNMMLVFSVIIIGVMNIFLISRHTRQDEELGRLEVIRSLPIGRLANLTSALIAALLTNLVIALCTGLGLYLVRADGMDFLGCILFGAALCIIGLLFAAITAIFCQLTTNNRTATGLAMMLLMALYLLRAIGDVSAEALSLISPLGLILRIESFVNNYWWPIGILAGITALLTALALSLARIRDLGRGLFAERPGKQHAAPSLSSTFGLALRLIRTPIIVWAATIFVFAAMYGSVFGDLESFIESNAMLQAVFSQTSDYSLTEQFIALLMAIMTIISSIPIIQFIGRITVEEKRGHTEHLFGRAESRSRQMAAYLIPALVMSVVHQFLSALGFWSVGSMVLETAPSLATFLTAAMSYLPAVWVLIGLTMVLTAFFPGLVSLSYLYLGYSFITIYLGTMANFPEWSRKITPFGHIPQYPIEPLDPLPLVILTLIAIGFGLAGFYGYRRRDMLTQ
jgi:ABC-2 type transport system permease protein